MAAQAASFERFFERGPVEDHRGERERPSWTSWESWITLTLVILVQLPVVGSLQSSDWVSEMPSLLAPAAAGLVAAWALGHSRLNGMACALAGFAVGVVTTIVLVLARMRLADPESSGALDRWAEFRLRLLEWGRALWDGGISADPLPFVVLLVGAVFLVAFISTWAVVRWNNPWVALVPGGFVLLTNISYLPGQPSSAFIFFVLAAVLLVARLTFLDALSSWRRDGVRPDDGMSMIVLGVGGVIAVVLIAAAWMIPTANNWGPVSDAWSRALAPVTTRVDQLGQLFVGVGSKKPIPIHALGAALPLQGKVVLDTTLLYEVVADREMNLRGAVYDGYTGAGWRLTSAAAADLLGTTVESAQLGTPATRAELRETTLVDVTVVADEAPRGALLSAGDPLATDAEANVLLDSAARPLALVPVQREAPDSYTTVGTLSVAAVETLRAAGTEYPTSIRQRYTALPADLPPEVAGLTRTIVEGAQNPYEAARLVEAYLRENYRFSYDIEPAPPGRDAVAHFLFESNVGYFDQFASAMAVMLRTAGIPTRVAAGFALDDADLNPTTKAYEVTEESAWSWPEVYFPGLGWVEFNPTPSRETVARSGDDSEARAAAGSLFDSDTFMDEELEALLLAELMALEDQLNSGSAGALDGQEQQESGARELIGRVIGWTIIGAFVLLVVIVAARLLWERAFRGLAPAEKRWAKVQRLAAWAGIRTHDDRTPVESAADLAPRTGEPAAVRALALAYTRTRYGGPDALEESEDEAKHLDQEYRTVRGPLWRLVLRRVTRGGRTVGGPLARRSTAARALR